MDLRKIRFVLVLFLALGALAFSGCELEEDPDADMTTGTDTNTNTDTAGDTSEDTTPSLSYRFIRIDDVSGPGVDIDSGADIDAILLEKSDGTSVGAETLEGFEHGGGQGDAVNPNDALGQPDSFTDWEGTDPVCDLGGGYVSLGGDGGLLIVGMPQDIETGDTITVLEVGGCTGNEGGAGIPDAIEVSVSVGNDIDGSWTFVTSGEGPVISASVPTLPQN